MRSLDKTRRATAHPDEGGQTCSDHGSAARTCLDGSPSARPCSLRSWLLPQRLYRAATQHIPGHVPLAAQAQSTEATDSLAGLVMEDNSGNPVASAELLLPQARTSANSRPISKPIAWAGSAPPGLPPRRIQHRRFETQLPRPPAFIPQPAVAESDRAARPLRSH